MEEYIQVKDLFNARNAAEPLPIHPIFTLMQTLIQVKNASNVQHATEPLISYAIFAIMKERIQVKNPSNALIQDAVQHLHKYLP